MFKAFESTSYYKLIKALPLSSLSLCMPSLPLQVQDQGVDPNLRDGDGATPLHFAASRGHLSVVRWLLNHGAKLSLDKYGKSPINDAAENQQVEVSIQAGREGKVKPSTDNYFSPPTNYSASMC